MLFARVLFACLFIQHSLCSGLHKLVDDFQNIVRSKHNRVDESAYNFLALLDILFNDGSKKICTGSIIEKNIVITTASCFLDHKNQNKRAEIAASFVVIGSKRMYDAGYEQYVPIEKVVIHPDYYGWKGNLALVYTFAVMTSDKPGRKKSLYVGTLTAGYAITSGNVTMFSWGRPPNCQKDYDKDSLHTSEDTCGPRSHGVTRRYYSHGHNQGHDKHEGSKHEHDKSREKHGHGKDRGHHKHPSDDPSHEPGYGHRKETYSNEERHHSHKGPYSKERSGEIHHQHQRPKKHSDERSSEKRRPNQDKYEHSKERSKEQYKPGGKGQGDKGKEERHHKDHQPFEEKSGEGHHKGNKDHKHSKEFSDEGHQPGHKDHKHSKEISDEERRPGHRDPKYSKEISGEGQLPGPKDHKKSKDISDERQRPEHKGHKHSKELSREEHRPGLEDHKYSKERSDEKHKPGHKDREYSKEKSEEKRRPAHKDQKFSKEMSGERQPGHKEQQYSKERSGESPSVHKKESKDKDIHIPNQHHAEAEQKLSAEISKEKVEPEYKKEQQKGGSQGGQIEQMDKIDPGKYYMESKIFQMQPPGMAPKHLQNKTFIIPLPCRRDRNGGLHCPPGNPLIPQAWPRYMKLKRRSNKRARRSKHRSHHTQPKTVKRRIMMTHHKKSLRDGTQLKIPTIRRIVGNKMNTLSVNEYEVMGLEECFDMVEALMPRDYWIKGHREFICYTGPDPCISNADVGSPALYQNGILSVTVGSVQHHDKHAIIALNLGCFCDWLTFFIPDTQDRTRCNPDTCRGEPHIEDLGPTVSTLMPRKV